TKKKEEIFNSIIEELEYKEKLVLGLKWFREVLIPKEKEEYESWHIEWSKGFLADDIELSLKRINLFKNQAWNIALISLMNKKARNQEEGKKGKKTKRKEKKTNNLKEKIEKKEKVEKDKTVK
ncbi:769_t:CDS:2, partial [Gigaspora margarita]